MPIILIQRLGFGEVLHFNDFIVNALLADQTWPCILPVGDLAANIKEEQAPVDCAGLTTLLIGMPFTRMTPTITSLSEEMDNIEENVLDGRANVRREQTVSIPKKTIIVDSYLVPQRDLIRDFPEVKIDWFADHNHQRMIEEPTLNRSGNMLRKKKP